MTKRKSPRLRLADMPQLTDSLAVDIDEEPDRFTAAMLQTEAWARTGMPATLIDARAAQRDTAKLLLRHLDRAELWWIAEPMGRLALAASAGMPDWDWAAVRPSPSGLIMWEGSTGVEGTVHTHRELWQGLFWAPWAEGDTLLMPVVRASDSVAPTRSTGIALSAASWLLRGRDGIMGEIAQAPPALRLTALLGATLILAKQPTIVTRHAHGRGERMLAERGPHLPVTVTQILLRQSVRDAFEADRAEQGEGPTWHLKHRIVVREHWRQQRVGPGRTLRRPVYIAPYIKGPADGPLRLTTAVNVWRR